MPRNARLTRMTHFATTKSGALILKARQKSTNGAKMMRRMM